MITRPIKEGIVLILLSAIFIYGGIKLGIGKSHYPGPGFFPFLVGITLGVLSLTTIISTIKGMVMHSLGYESKTRPVVTIQAALILGVLFLFGVFVEKVGFFVCTFVATFFLLKVISKEKWYFLLFVAILACTGIYLLFNVLLDVRLPMGILRPYM